MEENEKQFPKIEIPLNSPFKMKFWRNKVD